MHVFLSSLGCRLNEAELARWRRQLGEAGYRVVGDVREAHIAVLNTCAVTAEAGRKSRKLARRLRRENPDVRLVLTGCWTAIDPDAADLAGVDLIVSNRDKDRLVELIAQEVAQSDLPAVLYGPVERTRAFIKVQDGCRNRCAFCIVTVARGAERSRTIDDVVAEIGRLAASGVKEVVLTGVHLGGYGTDLGTDLYTLVEAVLQSTSVPRVRLSSLEPWDLPEHFWTLWQDRRLQPNLHLPLQSGSDRILRRMARRCDTAHYRALVDAARAAIPDLTLTSDVIVGFPGEDDEAFAETMQTVGAIGFGHLHIFPYSPRTGTAAAKMPRQVPGPVKRARSRQLHALAADMREAHLARFVGQRRDVLWEGSGEPLATGARRWLGYTDNYLRCETTATGGTDLGNRITAAHLAESTGQHYVAAVG